MSYQYIDQATQYRDAYYAVDDHKTYYEYLHAKAEINSSVDGVITLHILYPDVELDEYEWMAINKNEDRYYELEDYFINGPLGNLLED